MIDKINISPSHWLKKERKRETKKESKKKKVSLSEILGKTTTTEYQLRYYILVVNVNYANKGGIGLGELYG